MLFLVNKKEIEPNFRRDGSSSETNTNLDRRRYT